MTSTDIRRFPALRQVPTLWRLFLDRDPETGAKRTPWFLSSRPAHDGRFDLRQPEGTCYASDRRYGAWLETFRGCGLVDRVDVERRRLMRITAEGSPRVADLAAARARAYGVTLDLAGGGDHRAGQDLADRLRAASYDAISAPLRHDPTASARTVGIFGPAGPRHRLTGWRYRSTPVLADVVLPAELAPFGTGVLARPYDVPVDRD